MTTHAWDPNREPVAFAYPTLTDLFVNRNGSFATVSEYAAAAELGVDQVVDTFGVLLDSHTLRLDAVDGEVFVHTAPYGRPAPSHHVDVPPNLWERLSDACDEDDAAQQFGLIRSLERVGWRVETHRPTLLFELGAVTRTPVFGVRVGSRHVPVVAFPRVEDVIESDGVLSDYRHAGAAAVAIVCRQGQLDPFVSAARRWILSQAWAPDTAVLLLEAPRFQPVLLSVEDGSVQPISLSRIV